MSFILWLHCKISHQLSFAPVLSFQYEWFTRFDFGLANLGSIRLYNIGFLKFKSFLYHPTSVNETEINWNLDVILQTQPERNDTYATNKPNVISNTEKIRTGNSTNSCFCRMYLRNHQLLFSFFQQSFLNTTEKPKQHKTIRFFLKNKTQDLGLSEDDKKPALSEDVRTSSITRRH